MEMNTVILSLEVYLKLRDTYENTIKDGVPCFDSRQHTFIFYSKDDALSEMGRINEEQINKLQDVAAINSRLEYEIKTLDSIVEKIKKMSILQFIKWRKK